MGRTAHTEAARLLRYMNAWRTQTAMYSLDSAAFGLSRGDCGNENAQAVTVSVAQMDVVAEMRRLLVGGRILDSSCHRNRGAFAVSTSNRTHHLAALVGPEQIRLIIVVLAHECCHLRWLL